MTIWISSFMENLSKISCPFFFVSIYIYNIYISWYFHKIFMLLLEIQKFCVIPVVEWKVLIMNRFELYYFCSVLSGYKYMLYSLIPLISKLYWFKMLKLSCIPLINPVSHGALSFYLSLVQLLKCVEFLHMYSQRERRRKVFFLL